MFLIPTDISDRLMFKQHAISTKPSISLRSAAWRESQVNETIVTTHPSLTHQFSQVRGIILTCRNVAHRKLIEFRSNCPPKWFCVSWLLGCPFKGSPVYTKPCSAPTHSISSRIYCHAHLSYCIAGLPVKPIKPIKPIKTSISKWEPLFPK